MKKLLLLGLAAASVSFAACQPKSYKIEGQGDAVKDGDTLFLTIDPNTATPIDTAVVKDGKFEFSADIDSTVFGQIYSPKDPKITFPLFVEPGTIKVTMSSTPAQCKVSGTETNERWQELNDTTVRIGMKADRIVAAIHGNPLSDSEQQALMQQVNKINEEFKACTTTYAERNIDNELGFFMLTYYPEEVISADKKLELIGKMPQKMQQRPQIKSLKAKLIQLNQFAVGKQIKDITMTDIDGKNVSLMAEVKRNKLTIIDFWASWCGPCRQEMPNVVKLYNDYGSKGLGIVGISLDENKNSWMSAVKSLGMKWTQLSDLKGWQNAAARMFSIESIPHTIVVDQNGKILERGLRGEQLTEFVAEKLK